MKKLLALLLLTLIPSLSLGNEKYCESINKKINELQDSYIFYDEGLSQIYEEGIDYLAENGCDLNCYFLNKEPKETLMKTDFMIANDKKFTKYLKEWDDVIAELKNNYTLWKYCN